MKNEEKEQEGECKSRRHPLICPCLAFDACSFSGFQTCKFKPTLKHQREKFCFGEFKQAGSRLVLPQVLAQFVKATDGVLLTSQVRCSSGSMEWRGVLSVTEKKRTTRPYQEQLWALHIRSVRDFSTFSCWKHLIQTEAAQIYAEICLCVPCIYICMEIHAKHAQTAVHLWCCISLGTH